MTPNIILASQSAGRKTILEKLNIPFDVIPSDFEEDMTLPLSAPELATHLSKGKAASISKKYPDAIVIAADTFVIFKNKFIGKPKDEEHIITILSELSGNTHDVITALTVSQGEKVISEVVYTHLKMRDLPHEEIVAYAKTGEALGKAGAYAMQGNGAKLIEKYEGDYFNVLGMPISNLVKILNEQFLVPVKLPTI